MEGIMMLNESKYLSEICTEGAGCEVYKFVVKTLAWIISAAKESHLKFDLINTNLSVSTVRSEFLMQTSHASKKAQSKVGGALTRKKV